MIVIDVLINAFFVVHLNTLFVFLVVFGCIYMPIFFKECVNHGFLGSLVYFYRPMLVGRVDLNNNHTLSR